jgi:hypothetical protein
MPATASTKLSWLCTCARRTVHFRAQAKEVAANVQEHQAALEDIAIGNAAKLQALDREEAAAANSGKRGGSKSKTYVVTSSFNSIHSVLLQYFLLAYEIRLCFFNDCNYEVYDESCVFLCRRAAPPLDLEQLRASVSNSTTDLNASIKALVDSHIAALKPQKKAANAAWLRSCACYDSAAGQAAIRATQAKAQDSQTARITTSLHIIVIIGILQCIFRYKRRLEVSSSSASAAVGDLTCSAPVLAPRRLAWFLLQRSQA